MNTPKAIELALTAMIRQYAEIGSGTLVRPWQSLDTEGAFDPASDRVFPCVDVRFAPPMTQDADGQATFVSSGSVTIMTKAQDDASHQECSAIYAAVFEVLQAIHRAMFGFTATAYWTEFVSLVVDNGGDSPGGVTFGSPTAPMDDAGLNAIGIGFDVHYSVV
jgi:hypothetical protein